MTKKKIGQWVKKKMSSIKVFRTWTFSNNVDKRKGAEKIVDSFFSFTNWLIIGHTFVGFNIFGLKYFVKRFGVPKMKQVQSWFWFTLSKNVQEQLFYRLGCRYINSKCLIIHTPVIDRVSSVGIIFIIFFFCEHLISYILFTIKSCLWFRSEKKTHFMYIIIF